MADRRANPGVAAVCEAWSLAREGISEDGADRFNYNGCHTLWTKRVGWDELWPRYCKRSADYVFAA